MSGKSLLLWVVLPFVLLCAAALWLIGTDPAPPAAQPPANARAAAPARGLAPPPADTPATQVPVAEPPAPTPAEPAPPDALDEAALEPGDAGAAPGTVDRDALRAAVAGARPLVRQCFLDVTERYPGPQSVRLRFTLEPQGTAGRVRDAEVAESSIQDPFLLACFVDALEDVQFPAPRGGPVTVTFPFRFRAARPGLVPDAG
jgi:hypothetical protein